MRKFRLDSASSKEVQLMAHRLWDGLKMDWDSSARAERLLLHWWAVGHDPRRALNSCRNCNNGGVDWYHDSAAADCSECNGTGRREPETGVKL